MVLLPEGKIINNPDTVKLIKVLPTTLNDQTFFVVVLKLDDDSELMLDRCTTRMEAEALADVPVHALNGGTDRWLAEELPVEAGIDTAVGDTDDVWYKPYEHREAQEKFMRDYLTWEVALVEQIERDGTSRFQAFDQPVDQP